MIQNCQSEKSFGHRKHKEYLHIIKNYNILSRKSMNQIGLTQASFPKSMLIVIHLFGMFLTIWSLIIPSRTLQTTDVRFIGLYFPGSNFDPFFYKLAAYLLGVFCLALLSSDRTKKMTVQFLQPVPWGPVGSTHQRPQICFHLIPIIFCIPQFQITKAGIRSIQLLNVVVFLRPFLR